MPWKRKERVGAAAAAVTLAVLAAVCSSPHDGNSYHARLCFAGRAGVPDQRLESTDRASEVGSASCRRNPKLVQSRLRRASSQDACTSVHAGDDDSDRLKEAAMSLISIIAAVVVGAASALADGASAGSSVEDTEAAWAVINRSFYDQRFNGQDWQAARQKYLNRAERGEAASKLVREMVASLGDQYSRVIDSDAFEKMTAYDPLGVGVVLNKRDEDEVIIASPPFKESAAAQAGLKAGDVVLALDGRSMASESLLTAMDRIARADSPTVAMTLRRKSVDASGTASSSDFEVTLNRNRSPAAASSAAPKILDFGVVPATAGKGGQKVGYLRLKSFGSRSPLEIQDALTDMRQAGANELVLDLRGNLGGSYQAALEVAALFLEPQSVASHVQTKSAVDQPLRVLGDSSSNTVAKEPMVVLTDGFSASASEVLAAALRGNCRAALVGERTYGKAALQSVFGLPSGEAIVLTVAKYSGPNRLQIAGGLQPDYSGKADPVAGLGRFASAAGLMSAPLPTAEYADLDFGAARENALRSCVPELLS